MWKDIKDYEGKYQVSYRGQIRRLYQTKPPKLLTPYRKKTCKKDWLFIKLFDFKGNHKEIAIHILVAEAFLGNKKPGDVVAHKNRIVSDNFYQNLIYISQNKLGKQTGGLSQNKPVVKINKKGEITEKYLSTRDCGRKNNLSGQAISDRCNNKVKKIFINNFAYAWLGNEKELIIKIKEVEND